MGYLLPPLPWLFDFTAAGCGFLIVAGLVRVRKFTKQIKPKSHDFGYEAYR